MTRCTSMHAIRAFLSLRSTHRSRAGSHGDYFRTRLGFRDYFSRKSTLPFVSRIKFALLFFPYSTTPFARYRQCLVLFLFFFLYLSLFLFLSIDLVTLSIPRRKRRKKRERRRAKCEGCERIDIGLVLDGPRHEAFFASNQSNE